MSARCVLIAAFAAGVNLLRAEADIQIGLLLERRAAATDTAVSMMASGIPHGAGGWGEQIEGWEGTRLLELCYVAGTSSSRSRVGANIEHVYPIEWDPAEIGRSVEPGDAESVVRIVPSSPTAFDARYLGHQLEFEAREAGGGTMVSVASDSVTIAGELEYGSGPSAAKQPLFDRRALSSQLRPRFGKRELIGAHPLKTADAEHATEMVFASAYPLGDLPAFEGDPDADPFAGPQGLVELSPSIAVRLEFVEADRALFLELMEAGPRTDPTGFIDGALEKGEAKPIVSSYLRLRSGQRGKAEDLHEFIYPTEFEPSEFGIGFSPPDAIPAIPQPPALMFEMRPVGLATEAVAVVGVDEKSVLLDLAANYVNFIRFIDYGHGGASDIQPVFASWIVAVSVALQDGEPMLVSAFTPRDHEFGAPRSDRIVLLIATVGLGKL